MQLDKEELQEDPKQGQFAKTRGTVLCFLPGNATNIFCVDSENVNMRF